MDKNVTLRTMSRFRVLLTFHDERLQRLRVVRRLRDDEQAALDTYGAAIRLAERFARKGGKDVRVDLQLLHAGRWSAVPCHFNGFPDAPTITLHADGYTWHTSPPSRSTYPD